MANTSLSGATVIDKPFGLTELATRIRIALDAAPVDCIRPLGLAMEQTA